LYDGRQGHATNVRIPFQFVNIYTDNMNYLKLGQVLKNESRTQFVPSRKLIKTIKCFSVPFSIIPN